MKITKELCDKWFINKNINPITSRKIKETGAIYKELSKKCSLNPLNPNKTKKEKEVKLTQSQICNKWLENKNINPITARKIKETGTIYKQLSKKCSLNPIKSENKSENKKINAYKKIHKLFTPYIKRVSVNIIDRINYYLIIKKYILSIKEPSNCVRLYNIDPKTYEPIYRIGSKIILDKKIGSESAYGIVYLSHFKSDVIKGTKYDKLNKFAVKITSQSKENKLEINVLKKLTRYVIELKCPHFPIIYGSLKCNNSVIKSNIQDDYEIAKVGKYNKKLYPILINKNKSLLIQINELASGDLYSILNKIDILPTFTQVILSIMFFHNYIKAFHYDPHVGNFLYHKIKPGGYFHYNLYGKDYYLENQGYLWVIWDFGLIKPFNNIKNKIFINYDYTYLYNRLRMGYTPDKIDIITKLYDTIIDKYITNDLTKLSNMNIDILNYLIKNNPSFTNNKPSNIINKTPYVII
jgi:hypothetical protein